MPHTTGILQFLYWDSICSMLYYTVLNFLCLIMANSVKQFCCLFRYLIYDTALIKQNCLIKLYGKPILILFFISTVQSRGPWVLDLPVTFVWYNHGKDSQNETRYLCWWGIKGKIVLYWVVLKKDFFSFTTHKENYDHHDKVYDQHLV